MPIGSDSRRRDATHPSLRSIARLIGLALALSCFGCAAGGLGGGTPGWVNGESPPDYPNEKYLSAIGTGASLTTAQAAAKAALSERFAAKVQNELELVDRETVVGDDAVQSSEFLSNIQIETSMELQGAEAPLHWRDPKTGEIWALAVLARATECRRVRSEGSDLETQLGAAVRERDRASNPIVAIRAARDAVRLGRTLDGLQARSRVLGLRCLGARSVSTGALEADAATRLGRLSFVVKTRDVSADEPLPQLREDIAGLLTDRGFQVGPTEDATAVPIEARLRLRRVERGTDWVEYRWEGSAEVGSPVPGDPAILTAQADGAESHPEASTARLRARRAGEKALLQQIGMRLDAFLEEGSEGGTGS